MHCGTFYPRETSVQLVILWNGRAFRRRPAHRGTARCRGIARRGSVPTRIPREHEFRVCSTMSGSATMRDWRTLVGILAAWYGSPGFSGKSAVFLPHGPATPSGGPRYLGRWILWDVRTRNIPLLCLSSSSCRFRPRRRRRLVAACSERGGRVSWRVDDVVDRRLANFADVSNLYSPLFVDTHRYPRLDRRDTGTFDNPSTSRRKQEDMSAPRVCETSEAEEGMVAGYMYLFFVHFGLTCTITWISLNLELEI